MEDDIVEFSQKNFPKNSDIEQEQDKFSESVIPPIAGENNNSNVFGSSFEDLLKQTNLNMAKENDKKSSEEKKESKDENNSSFKNKRQIPKNKVKQLQKEKKENNEEEELEENDDDTEEEEEEENEEIEEEEEEQEDEQEEKSKKEKEKKKEKEEKKEKNEKDKNKKDKETKQIQKKKKKISSFEIIEQDEYLKPFELNIKQRMQNYKKVLNEILKNEKSLENFSQSYKYMGLNLLPNGDIKYREYAPGAKGVSLFGEFNNWNKEQ